MGRLRRCHVAVFADAEEERGLRPSNLLAEEVGRFRDGSA